jgi:hypothetical protein
VGGIRIDVAYACFFPVISSIETCVDHAEYGFDETTFDLLVEVELSVPGLLDGDVPVSTDAAV